MPGLQLDRRCGSGLQAVLYAACQVASGAGSVVVAGGVESMSSVEHYALGLRTGVRSGGVELMDRLVRARETAGGKDHPVPGGMLETAENLRRDYDISREEQDELAVRSQQRAGAAHEAGRFAEELVPVTVPGRRGRPDVVVDRDEHPRPDTTLEQLAALRPVREKIDAASTVTAGNASGQNDGAAMCVVTTREEADRRGLRPLLALRSWAVAGVGPEVMGIGPVPATAAALERAGLTLDEMDVIELNEAFAAQVLACLREWKVDPTDERLNPNGSGISLGHPVGATGARILATMAHEMQRRESRYGLETMCIGGGQGLAAIFERVAVMSRRPIDRAVDVHHVVTGPEDAPVVVLSNSLGADLRMWDGVVDALAEHFRVVRYDTRGHGRSPRCPGPYSIDDLADDVVALLDTLGVAKAHLVGLSLGGMTGMRLAARDPERVDRLVLLCTGAHLEAGPGYTERAAQVRADGTGVGRRGRRGQPLVHPGVPGGAPRRPRRERGDVCRRPPPRATPVAARPSPRWTCVPTCRRSRPPPSPSPAPTTRRRRRRYLEEIAEGVPDGRLLVVPDAAHLAAAEQPRGRRRRPILEHLGVTDDITLDRLMTSTRSSPAPPRRSPTCSTAPAWPSAASASSASRGP